MIIQVPLIILVSLSDVKSGFPSVISEMSTPKIEGYKRNHPSVNICDLNWQK